MNERMYELINQCFIGTTDGKLSELNTVANIEKFAELIIRECAKIADQERDHSIGCGYITKTKSMLIKEYFGVER
jgi:hypothetical protein